MPCAKLPAPRRRPPLPMPPPLQARRARRWPVALAVAALALLVLLPSSLQRAPELLEPPPEAWPTDVHADPKPVRPGQTPQPVEGHKRAPCDTDLYVTVGGYCWLPHERKPPHCPARAVAHEGRCLVPVVEGSRPPTSVDGGAPEGR